MSSIKPQASIPAPSISLATVVAAALVVAGCAAPEQSGDSGGEADAATDASVATVTTDASALAAVLADGQAVFGTFSGPTTREQGALMGQNRELDFVFYSLESGPFDIMTTELYMAGVAEGSGAEAPHPMILRVPPIRDGEDAARANVATALDAGVAAIVFPHVESGAEAAVAVSAMGDELWPGNPSGSLLSILIIEDRSGVERADEIVATPGVSVVFAGPGDLRRSYEGDMEAVEAAIQTVLAACQAHGVPCGITAGVDDIAERIGQGFRMFIVNDAAAVSAGRAAAGR
ncbi:MAG: aldolase/citrate lyase family protein [Gemmatimonadota bacterium]|nr:aldolase/citrate lyase family protein [Gemmatimonadota bacterium]MDE2866984.1 aldolase/citrate lyase family protein [Gemmatimonadota bacterium]